ncbi:MAG: hypothetical protein HY704_10965 [Gemmatimonadetes bacterium]|nr:hypothetical protein [Gemmatimonadota bacterium]
MVLRTYSRWLKNYSDPLWLFSDVPGARGTTAGGLSQPAYPWMLLPTCTPALARAARRLCREVLGGCTRLDGERVAAQKVAV